MQILLVMLYMIFKHFMIDFVLQGPYQYKNKGTYLHPGGLLHAGLHVLGSLPLAIIFGAWWLLAVEFVVHYHMDWFKMWFNAKSFVWTRPGKGLDIKVIWTKEPWGPLTTDNFWIFLGFDQMVHYMTYVVMIAVWCAI